MTFRTLHGLTFLVISPSLYRLPGRALFLAFITARGWYLCSDVGETPRPLHSRPYASVDAAAKFLAEYYQEARSVL